MTPSLSRENLIDLSVPVGVLAIILALITPLPPVLLDVLIVADIMISVIVLMVAMYITRPVEFSVFPTTLLLMTLFRLALNISSSRLILLHGDTGTGAAGHVIEAFGTFVVGGNYIIGAVIFLVLIAIQYVVINHGAVRISEVAARFTLDALPGKQMSIDSDMNAGLIDEAEARQRRKLLAAEAEFYGAMDGASRFTQRDAVASVLITGINILAGFLIGVLQHGMEWTQALQTYTVLTIGDGLVTVVPALMISISGGMIVTRTSTEARLGADFRKQVFSNSEPLLLAAGILVGLALLPGMPKLHFMVMGGGLGVLAWRMRQRAARPAAAAAKPAAAKENLEALLKVEPLQVELGLGLVRLVEGGPQSPLLRRIASIRRQLAQELGYLLPAIKVADNLALRAMEYVISLKGAEIGRYELPQGREMAIAARPNCAAVEGTQTREPAFGLAAWWIAPDRAEAARTAGYTVVDAVSVLGTHLSELIRQNVAELFSRQDAKAYIDRMAQEYPRVVEDVVPKLLPLGLVQRVLQNLLRERAPIRDGLTLLEALGEAGASTRNPVLLTEFARQAIRRTLVKPYVNAAGDLPAYLVDPSLERMVEAGVEHGEQSSHLNLAPESIRDLLDRIKRKVGAPESPVVAITSTGSRYFLRQLVEPSIRNLFFLSPGELPPTVRVVSLGVIQ